MGKHLWGVCVAFACVAFATVWAADERKVVNPKGNGPVQVLFPEKGSGLETNIFVPKGGPVHLAPNEKGCCVDSKLFVRKDGGPIQVFPLKNSFPEGIIFLPKDGTRVHVFENKGFELDPSVFVPKGGARAPLFPPKGPGSEPNVFDPKDGGSVPVFPRKGSVVEPKFSLPKGGLESKDPALLKPKASSENSPYGFSGNIQVNGAACFIAQKFKQPIKITPSVVFSYGITAGDTDKYRFHLLIKSENLTSGGVDASSSGGADLTGDKDKAIGQMQTFTAPYNADATGKGEHRVTAQITVDNLTKMPAPATVTLVVITCLYVVE